MRAPHFYVLKSDLSKLSSLSFKELSLPDNLGQTPSFLACLMNDMKSVDFLLSKGIDFSSSTKKGLYPLLVVLQNRNEKLALKLLSNPSKIGDINRRSETGNTPLHWAVIHNFPKVVKKLVDLNANSKI
jgi:ankyrin repeat protein